MFLLKCRCAIGKKASLLPRVDPSGCDAGSSYPFSHSACHLPRRIFKGRQGTSGKRMRKSTWREWAQNSNRVPPFPCCTEINEDYSVEINGGDLFWACYSWGVSTIPCVWRGLKRRTKEWASFIMKMRKASGMLWLEVVGLAGDGLTGSGVSSVIGSRSIFRFLSLALSWKQDNN